LNEIDYGELADELGIRGRRAGNQIYARCPLHSDRTPSFSLNVVTGTWTCHKGCGPGYGRDFPTLVSLVLEIPLIAAHKWVLDHGGLLDNDRLYDRLQRSLEALQPKPETPADPEWKAYWNSLGRKQMPIAFLRRGFDWAFIERWDIRYDEVREHIVIPIFDLAGEHIAIVSRDMRPDAPVRYLNNEGFQKARNLYPLSAQDTGHAIVLVEGPLDALWLRDTGFRGAAMFGSELSLDQIHLLRKARITKIVLAFDNDDAGKTGLHSALMRLLSAGWLFNEIQIAVYPQIARENGTSTKDANDLTKDELRGVFKKLRAVEPKDLMEAN
jgi:DNA primase